MGKDKRSEGRFRILGRKKKNVLKVEQQQGESMTLLPNSRFEPSKKNQLAAVYSQGKEKAPTNGEGGGSDWGWESGIGRGTVRGHH